MTSINTNIAALSAQNSLKTASDTSSRLVSVLSSGNKIINPSDDAAGLAIGTVLSTAAQTLRTALGSANQANSLLSVADGGLSNLGKILQRMKALSVQSNSGTNTDAERSFLNQEYQALKTQVDSIAGNTKFNTTNLLNGSISGSVDLTTNTNNGSAANTAVTIFTVIATLPTDGQTITVNGATVTFTTDSTRTDRAFVGGTVTATAQNIAAFLNASTDSRISPYKYSNTAGALEVKFGGGAVRAGGTFTVSSANGTYTGTAATATIGANGTDGLSAGRVSYSGTVQDTIIQNITRGGIDTALVRNNSDFIGNIQGFNVTYTGADAASVSIKIGSITYTGAIADTTVAADTAVTLTGVHDDGVTTAGSFAITLRANSGTTVATQKDANDLADRLNRAFSDVTFYQNRDVNSYVGGGDILTNGIVTGSLLDTHVDLRADDFASGVKVGGVSVQAPAAGSDSGVIKITINGETYTSRTDVGNTLAADSYTVFTSTTNPNHFIGFHNGDTAIKFTNADEAASFESALKAGFGLDAGGTGLTFQVGISSSETIDVKLAAVDANSLGIANSDIGTQNGAIAASSLLDSAITQVTGARAAVGALQSRFNFAASTLQSGITNTESAADGYLGADVAAASTDFASAQVKTLASISVLAQANQLPQNLLKLLG